MKTLLLLTLLVGCIVALVACAPTTRLVSRRCPVPTSAVLFDIAAGVTAMAVSAIKWESAHEKQSLAYTSLGIGFLGGTYFSELSCLR